MATTQTELTSVNQQQQQTDDVLKNQVSITLSSRFVGVAKPDEDVIKRLGMRVVFKNLKYSVKHMLNKKETLYLLRNVSGYFEPAKLTALMGPSGSGKSTLLDVLAGRKTQGTIEGDILFAGAAPSKQFLRRYTGYVEQFDTLIANLTVKEMLMYTAELKRPPSESYDDKERIVDAMIEKLALTVCKDINIGDETARGISGGQCKRTNIGLAMVTTPKVLFLDEPTSGLDSYTANDVMKVVKGLVADSITICSTIHSPTQFCFHLFDSIMLLVRGDMAFYGENSEHVIKYFEGLPGVDAFNEGGNEPEWITDIVTSADKQGLGEQFGQAFQISEECKMLMQQIEQFEKEKSNISEDIQKSLAVKRATTTSFWFGLKTLLRYRTAKNYRDPGFIIPRIAEKALMTFMISTVYWRIGDDVSPTDASQVANISGALFMWSIIPAFAAIGYIPIIMQERPLYVRERHDGLYRSITYLCAKVIDELLFLFFAILIFTAILWGCVGFQGSFVVFWINSFLAFCTGTICAYWVTAMSPNLEVAQMALPNFGITGLFFCGFLIQFSEIPDYWIWYSFCTNVRYVWSANMANQFDDDERNPPYLGSSSVVEYYDVDIFSIGGNLAMQFVFIGLFGFFAWLALTYKNFASR